MMNSDIARRRIVKSGWLKKQGGLVKTWHSRWFILNGDCLFYFAKEDDIKMLGNIYLPGNRIIEHSFKPEDPDKFLFEILPAKGQTKMSSNHDSFLLCGNNNTERQEWIAVIRKVMYSTVGGAIFGQKIEETMAYEHRRGNDLPCIVVRCVEFLLEHGLDTEGILRLPGRAALLRELKEAFDTGEKIVFRQSTHDVHTVASLLKSYFRELPESIVPCDFYQKFMNHALRFQDTENFEEVDNLKESLKQIPQDNFHILAYICQFLYKISEYSEVNKMTEWNLATVFGPNIIRHIDDNPTLFMATADLTQVLVNMMIANCGYLFPDDRLSRVNRRSPPQVPVDDLLRMSIANESDYEILTPVFASELAGLNIKKEANDNNRKSQSLPREETMNRARLSSLKRHGKLNLDIKGKPISSSHISGPLAPDSAPIPATRRSRRNNSTKDRNKDKADSDMSSDKSTEASPIEARKSFLPSDSVLLRSSLRRMQSEPVRDSQPIEDVPTEAPTLVTPMNSPYYNETADVFKMELLNLKNEYEERIRKMEDKFASDMNNLVQQLQAERLSKAEAIEKIMTLQTELTRYQLKYGELDASV